MQGLSATDRQWHPRRRPRRAAPANSDPPLDHQLRDASIGPFSCSFNLTSAYHVDEVNEAMQCYTELLPPTAVTHAVALPFLGSGAVNLVVAKTSLLQVFEVKQRNTSIDSSSPTRTARSALTLIAEYPLSGTVLSLAALTLPNGGSKSGGHALLIATRHAKLSLVEWDPENHRISTISIHYYEADDLLAQPFGPDPKERDSILAVDARSRCAALQFGAKQLAVLPFRLGGDELGGEGSDDDRQQEDSRAERNGRTPQGEGINGDSIATLKKRTTSTLDAATLITAAAVEGEVKETPYKASFVLTLPALDPLLTHPIHMAFLHEYRELTLGILSASQQPSTALLEERKDCCVFSAFAVDVEERSSTRIQIVENLPSDLWKVVPLALPVGGTLLVGTNEFVHVDQSGKVNAVAVNEFAVQASKRSMVDQSSLNMRLEDCEVEVLNAASGDLLVVLADASLALLEFSMLGRNVGGLRVTHVNLESGGAVLQASPSCVAAIKGGDFFIGSQDGDSSLLHWTKRVAAAPTPSRKRSHAQMLDSQPPITAVAADIEDDDDDAFDADELDEDDLYASSAAAARQRMASTALSSALASGAASYAFTLQDVLPSLGPIHNICLGRSSQTASGRLELLAGVGRGKSGRLAVLSRDIVPECGRQVEERKAGETWPFNSAAVQNLWCFNVNTQNDTADGESNSAARSKWSLMFVFDGADTRVYDVVQSPATSLKTATQADRQYIERMNTEFEAEGETLFISTLWSRRRIVQCRSSELRTYDCDLALSQIIPMLDEETDAELGVVATSFLDPYLLAVRQDGSVLMLQVDAAGDLEPLEPSPHGALGKHSWLGGCLYSAAALMTGETEREDAGVCAFLLSADGEMHVLALPGLQEVYTLSSLPHLPPVVGMDMPLRRAGARETLTELLMADIGPLGLERPCLVLRTAGEDVVLYEPFHYHQASISINGDNHTHDKTLESPRKNVAKNFATLRFRKLPNTYTLPFDAAALDSTADAEDTSSSFLPAATTATRPAPLQALQICGRSLVCIPGSAPSLILREATSLPKIMGLRVGGSENGGVRAFAPLPFPLLRSGVGTLAARGGEDDTEAETSSFALVMRHGKVSEYALRADTHYGTGWSVWRWRVGGGIDDVLQSQNEEVRWLAFHEDRGVWIVGVFRLVDFELGDEEQDGNSSGGGGGGREAADMRDNSLQPQTPQYTLHLLSASTYEIISSFEMPYCETITSLQVMPLEVSEHTHEQKAMLVVGTSTQHGEDTPARGTLTVFELIDVVPEPGRPETAIKLHVFSREETKGALTALEAFPGGLIGTAQGQKVMIRGLKEDGSCLPVAFLDAQCHITQLKTLAHSGLWLAGDAWKGLWFGGFVEEPYKLHLLGKSRAQMEIVTAEFLPFEGQLFILVTDADMDLHVLQYDPEDPKSSSGTTLLHKSTFHLGHSLTTMTLLPSTLAPIADQPLTNGLPYAATSRSTSPALSHILTTSLTGSIGLITPVDERTYRRLGVLQTQLTSLLEHAAALNPRAYRAVESEAFGGGGARGVLDGSIIQRVGELGTARRAEVLGRAGGDAWGLKSDLEILGGGGLGYL